MRLSILPLKGIRGDLLVDLQVEQPPIHISKDSEPVDQPSIHIGEAIALVMSSALKDRAISPGVKPASQTPLTTKSAPRSTA